MASRGAFVQWGANAFNLDLLSNLKSYTPVFSEGFTGANGASSPRFINGMGTANIQNNKFDMVSGTAGSYNQNDRVGRAISVDGTTNYSVADFQATFKITPSSLESYPQFVFRANDIATVNYGTGYSIQFSPWFANIRIQRGINYDYTDICVSTEIVPASSTEYNVKVVVEGGSIKVWFTTGAFSVLPQMSVADYTISGPGVMGFIVGGGSAAGGSGAHTLIDDLVVSTPSVSAPSTPATGITAVSASSRAAGDLGSVTSGSWTCPAPSNLTAGNILIAFTYAATTVTVNLETPAGWTTIANYGPGGGTSTIRAMWKVVTSGEASSPPANYTFSASAPSATNFYPATAIIQYSGANTTNPIDQFAGTVTGAQSTTQVAPSVTNTATNTTMICTFGMYNPATITSGAPSAMTSRTSSHSAGNEAIYVYDQNLTSAGATGTRTATSDAADQTSAMTITLKA